MYKYNEIDLQEIEKLRASKYANWDWNFGKSPNYNFRKKIRCAGGNLEVIMSIEKGIIEDFRIYGDFLAK